MHFPRRCGLLGYALSQVGSKGMVYGLRSHQRNAGRVGEGYLLMGPLNCSPALQKRPADDSLSVGSRLIGHPTMFDGRVRCMLLNTDREMSQCRCGSSGAKSYPANGMLSKPPSKKPWKFAGRCRD